MLQQTSQSVSGRMMRPRRLQKKDAKPEQQQTPGSKFVEEMRKIKVKRLRLVNRLGKPARKLPHHHAVVETGLSDEFPGSAQTRKSARENNHGQSPLHALGERRFTDAQFDRRSARAK